MQDLVCMYNIYYVCQYTVCLQQTSGKHTHTYVTKYLSGCAH